VDDFTPEQVAAIRAAIYWPEDAPDPTHDELVAAVAVLSSRAQLIDDTREVIEDAAERWGWDR
jgi:hypothetical protein